MVSDPLLGSFFIFPVWYTTVMIYLAADHRGFNLKESIKAFLVEQNYEIKDMGPLKLDEQDDYVDFARAALDQLVDDPEVNKAVLICGSGHGMSMVADKYRHVRAALGFNRYVAVQSREHEDVNVLVLASDWTKEKEAKDIVFDWLGSQFTGEERHIRRLKKIDEVEEKNFKSTPFSPGPAVQFEISQ